MSEGSGQRFCVNCGTEIRSGIRFCVSCGKPVNGGPASPDPDNPVPPPTPTRSLADILLGTFSGLTRLFSNTRSSSDGFTLSGLPNRGIDWFKNLPSVPKLILVGLLLLLLLTVLSPVARVVAIIAFVVSTVVLIARAVQRKPLREWVIAVVGSLMLIPVFGGISSALYESNVEEQSSSLEGTTSSNEDYPLTPEVKQSIDKNVIRALGPGNRSSFLYYSHAGIPGLDYDPYYEYRFSIWERYGYSCEYTHRYHTHPGFNTEGKSEESHPKTGLQYHWYYECVHYSYYQ